MSKTGRLACVALVACCGTLAATVAWSQEMPKPGAEIKAIAPIFGTSGTWRGNVEPGAMGPDSKATTSHGKAVARPVVGGMWYACDLEDTWGTGKEAMTWKGFMLVGYDVNSKAYKATCVDNMGSITMFDGTLNGTTFVLETPTEVMVMGQSMKDRLTWDFSDPKTIKFTDYHMPTGSDWKLCETATMTPMSKATTKPVAATKE